MRYCSKKDKTARLLRTVAVANCNNIVAGFGIQTKSVERVELASTAVVKLVPTDYAHFQRGYDQF